MRRYENKNRVNRWHFITHQDLHNITRRIQDFARHCHSEDATSVDRIAHELAEEDLCFTSLKTLRMLNIPACKKNLFCSF